MRAIPTGCESKHRYRSRKRALMAASEVARRRRVAKLYAYHCVECHCWHLTSWSPEDQKAYQARIRARERAADPGLDVLD